MAERKLLTPTELLMMRVLWKRGASTVHGVMEDLPRDRPLAYTSVSTILRILEKKDFLRSEKVGKTHIYSTTLTQAQYQSLTLEDVVENVFESAPLALVRRLVDDKKLSQTEIEEIQKLLHQGV